MLTRANVVATDRVLITGASGGVGSAAIQLAKARGAHVTAITSSFKAAEIQRIGADETLSRDEDLKTYFGTDTIDVVIDHAIQFQLEMLVEDPLLDLGDAE